MLDINTSENDPPINTSMKKSLLKRFRPNSKNDIETAIRLAHFIFMVGDANAARKLLESFLYFDMSEKEEKYEHLWYWNSHGIVLLAYLYKLEGKQDDCRKLVDIVEKSDFFQAEDSELHYEDLEELHDDYRFHMNDYLNETHKIRCQILNQFFISYLFFSTMREVTLSSDRERMVSELKIINERINNLQKLLEDELLNKT